MPAPEKTVSGSAPGLRRDAIGLREVLFQSITDMAPGAAIAASVPAGAGLAGIKVFSFVTPLAPPLSYMGPGVAGFMVLGVIYMLYLYRTNPQRVADVGLVHLDEGL